MGELLRKSMDSRKKMRVYAEIGEMAKEFADLPEDKKREAMKWIEKKLLEIRELEKAENEERKRQGKPWDFSKQKEKDVLVENQIMNFLDMLH